MNPVQRQATLALRTFNIEIASIKSIAKNRDSGDQRIQWWKMTLAEIYKVAKKEERERTTESFLFFVFFTFF